MVFARAFARSAPARAALAVTALAFAAACAPVLAPRGEANAPPHIAPKYFVTRDGLHLPLREWDAKDPKAVIVALHGMSDYSEAFDMPGPYWAAHDITVYAYDQRGFGAAPDPGIWAGGKAMRQDLVDFVDAVHAKYPGLPVYALGESMGGAVVLSSLADGNPPRAMRRNISGRTRRRFFCFTARTIRLFRKSRPRR
jgi:predicted alpha/beta-fold hydrolase